VTENSILKGAIWKTKKLLKLQNRLNSYTRKSDRITCSLKIKRCFIRKSCPSICDDLFAINLLAFCGRQEEAENRNKPVKTKYQARQI